MAIDELDWFASIGKTEISQPQASGISANRIVTKNIHKMRFVKRTEEVSKYIPDVINDGDCIHLISNGSFGSNELLNAIDDKFNIKKIYVTTWSINNDFIDIIKKINPNDFWFLCDESIKSRKIAYYGRLTKYLGHLNMKISLVKGMHSKVTLIETEKAGRLVYDASANYSNNVRIEQFNLYKEDNLYNFHLGWIKDLL